ncbi:DUF1643 domain-containing protein [Streptomyces synnematoformans]|uniref:DUF4326 domain-containing protein n=1 Tax=Streptomyces synnematoformans TaxID=415721 RepID=A0ABN2XFG6_9ACTN
MTRRIEPVMNGGLQLDLFAAAEEVFTLPRPRTDRPARPGPGTVADGPTTVVCLRGRKNDPAIKSVVYVGRPQFQGGWRLHGHVLSNPFKLGRDGDAVTVVAKYAAWLASHPQLLDRELPRLRGRTLGCWCPDGAPCHARVLAALADRHGGRMPVPEALAAWAVPRGLVVEESAAGTAVFSSETTPVYRYALTRTWGEAAGAHAGVALLNPSTAGGDQDDPTLRRVTAFARREGFAGAAVVNLFALRSTEPAALAAHPDPVGEHNDAVLDLLAAQQAPVIAGWGAAGTLAGRDTAVAEQLAARGVRLHCLGTTKDGHPRHPLYLPASAPLQPWPADEAEVSGHA